ncbi:MAG: primosomal protein N' [Desulfovibrionaceae bacterium]
MNYSIALLSPPYSTLTYTCPEYLPAALLRAGMRVAVPLGKGAWRVGMILREAVAPAGTETAFTLRPVFWPLERQPLLSAEHMDMVEQLSLRQYSTPGNILGHILPLGLRTTKVRLRYFDGAQPQLFSLKALGALAADKLRELVEAFVRGQADMLAAVSNAAAGEVCVLACDPPWPVRPSAQRQREVLEYLLEHGAITRHSLVKALGRASSAALRQLLTRGQVNIRPMDTELEPDEAARAHAALLPPPPAAFVLSHAQQAALRIFIADMDAGKAASHVLFGVTGSGKTAVYLELARECLARGRSIILLAPEVALALKLRRDAACTLPHLPVFFFHGYQSPALRERTFRELALRREPCIVVGTRSALFLPIPRLGAVVLDEEHDSSFKQDEGLNYQAKEVAWFRVAQNKALLILGSATPDVKTFHAVEQGRLSLVRLPERVGGGTLPAIQLVDITSLAGSESLLAPESEVALKETLQRGEQAVVLLNRRGYAPLMYCLDCHSVARCPHCEIGLTYHKGRERLVCHYCGYSVPFPSPCTTCKGMHYLPMGEGTEKLAESLSTLMPPQTQVLRLDRDSTRRPGRMEEILEAFARQEAQILVGTQMLSKGHHFPNVTLALVADGDLGLNLPDYRAAERTFQLLVQSAGRAGRGSKPGKVIIQTRDTSHYCWKYIQQADFEGFYADEIQRRQRRLYPPFVYLALIRINYAVEYAEGPSRMAALASFMRGLGREMELTVLGPAPAPLALLRGRKRFHCLLKGHDWAKLRQFFATVQQKFSTQQLRIVLDLDPVNML